MKFSIIIPTYNSENYIFDCLNSICQFNSDYEDLEVIIVDGLSTDKTIDILKEFSELLNINLISEKDNGIYDAMNKGVHLAKGEYLLFLGADDRILIKFKEIEHELKRNQITYGNVVMNPSKKIYDGKFTKYKLIEKNICHQAMFYPKEILLKNSYNIDYKMMADWDLNMRLWENYNFKFIEKNISEYNTNGLSSSAKDTVFRKRMVGLILKRFGITGLLYKLFSILKNRFNIWKLGEKND